VTTAGETYTLSDLALARRLERAEGEANVAFVESRRRLFPGSDAAWIEVAGALAMFDGPSSPLTQTFCLGMANAVTAEDLSRLEQFFQQRGAPVHHEVSPLADNSVVAAFHARGYQPFEFTNVMFRDIRRDISIAPAQAALHVRTVTPDDQAIWAETAAGGWSETPELAAFIAAFAPIVVNSRGLVSFLAELEGRAIATGAMSLSGGVALLAGASTIPEGRRRGAQLALLETRLRYAAEQGCDIAMMCALPGSASQRNAERQGFRIAYTRIKWRLPTI